ncbi:hypothetical protein N9901_02530, partial [Flavobacteriaceae bacterium]|nr:hypothetical protein [Flavobacteriaceae bacterium]
MILRFPTVKISVSLILISIAFNSTNLYSQSSFTCESDFFQVIENDVKRYKSITGSYETVGDPIAKTNATGYNEFDNFVYASVRSSLNGANENDVFRISSDATVEIIGDIGESSSAGDMDDNDTWWYKTPQYGGQKNFRRLANISTYTNASPYTYDPSAILEGDAEAVRVTFVGTTKGAVNDIVFFTGGDDDGEGTFYGLAKNGSSPNLKYWLNVYDYTDSTNPTVAAYEVLGDVKTDQKDNSFGAGWKDGAGRLYFSNNEGGIYQITDYTTINPTSSYLGLTEATSGNDGFSCPSAASTYDKDNDNILDPVDSDSDGDSITNTVESGGVNPYGDTDADGVFNYLDPNNAVDNSGDGTWSVQASFDFDGDGIPNFLDLDSDGDGIYDITEAGQSAKDTTGDGRYNSSDAGFNDADTDGIADDFDVDSGNLAVVPTDSDSGSEGADFLDIDADNDGIVDIIEGQASAGYIAPAGTDKDDDGIDDNYDTLDNKSNTVDTGTQNGTVNTDSSNDAIPDYRDTDSDNDGVSDLIEAYDTNNDGVADTLFMNNDMDNDGLDDNFDADDINFVVDNGGQTPASFPDDDEPGLDRDWRDFSGVPNVNFDVNNSGGGADDGSFNVTVAVGLSSAKLISDTDADIKDSDTANLPSVTITFGGLQDGADEKLTIAGTEFPLNADLTTTGTLNGNTVDISFITATGVFTVTSNGGGSILAADLTTLIRGLAYQNTKTTGFTIGNRTVKVKANDGTNDSNEPTVTINVIAPLGTAGTIVVTDPIVPGDNVTITVTDADLNTNAGAADTTTVTVATNGHAGTATITLTETGNATGIFTGTLNTSYGTVADGNNADTSINVNKDDTLTFSYSDAADNDGGTPTITDTTTVNGGATGTVSITDPLTVGGTATITVTDADLNTNTGTAESFDVVVSTDAYGATETVTVTETGVNTGIFSGSLATVFGAASDGNTTDGSINASNGDKITVTYDDALDA